MNVVEKTTGLLTCLIIFRTIGETVLTGVCDAVGVGVTRVAVLLGIVVLGDRAHLAGCGIAVARRRGASAAKRPAAVAAAFGLRGSAAVLGIGATRGCLAARRRGRLLLGCARTRVARIAYAPKRTLSTSPMWPIVVRSRCLFPQVIELDEFRLKRFFFFFFFFLLCAARRGKDFIFMCRRIRGPFQKCFYEI